MTPEQQIILSGSDARGDPRAEDTGFAAGSQAVVMAALTDEEREALLAEMAQAEEDRLASLDEVLEMLSANLLKKREEAVNGRAALGVEMEWTEDQDMYDGVDDANRADEARYRPRKPTAAGTAIGVKGDNEDVRSNLFLNITAPYVDAAAAKVADMLLPNDDRNFSIESSPIPDMPGETPTDSPLPADTPADKTPIAKAFDAMKAEAKRRAENAQRRIDDWLTDCNFQREMRAVIKSAAKLGSGVIKGPFAAPPTERMTWTDGEGGEKVLTKTVAIHPKSRAINLWDFFPDPACGNNIHNGSYTWERDRLGEHVVAGLRGKKGYFSHQIERVLAEGPQVPSYTGSPQDLANDSGKSPLFETWYFHGFLKRVDLESVGCDCPPEMEVLVPVMAQFINSRLVRVAVNPLAKSAFPYDLLPWSERDGLCWGVGVARRGRAPQRMVVAATRNMLDNAALTAGMILLLRRAGLTPTDGNWSLHGRKIFLVDDAKTGVKSAEDGIKAVELPSRINELLVIIRFGIEMMEQVTGLPALLQGQQGAKSITTLGTAQILSNNSNTFLRAIAKAFDDYITEPHVGRYVQWINEYGEADEIGDFLPDARGSSALVERELQNQWIAQMSSFVKDPAFRIDPAKWFEEFSKSVRFDPKRIQYTDAEWEKVSSQPPPVPYQVDVANIRAQADMEIAEAQNKARALEAQIEADGRMRAAAMDIAANEELSGQQIRARLVEVLAADKREREKQQTARDLTTAEMVFKRTSPDKKGI